MKKAAHLRKNRELERKVVAARGRLRACDVVGKPALDQRARRAVSIADGGG